MAKRSWRLAAKEAVKGLEPFQMTADQFRLSRGVRYPRPSSYQRFCNTTKWHRNIVKAAIEAGKPVPPQVRIEWLDN